LTDLRVLLKHLDGPLDAAAAKAAMQQLLKGLAACHAAGFVHRDLAPSNLLVSATGAVKLADFGQARRLPTAEATAAAAAQASKGKGNADDGEDEDAAPGGRLTPGAALCTRWYKAPELLFNSRSYGQGVDLWSAGCVFAEMLTGRPLLPGTSDIAQLAAMSDLLGSISEERWPGGQGGGWPGGWSEGMIWRGLKLGGVPCTAGACCRFARCPTAAGVRLGRMQLTTALPPPLPTLPCRRA
jgi:cell cycle related kinase